MTKHNQREDYNYEFAYSVSAVLFLCQKRWCQCKHKQRQD